VRGHFLYRHSLWSTSLSNASFIHPTEPVLKRALKINEELYGQVHHEVARAMDALGSLYVEQGSVDIIRISMVLPVLMLECRRL